MKFLGLMACRQRGREEKMSALWQLGQRPPASPLRAINSRRRRRRRTEDRTINQRVEWCAIPRIMLTLPVQCLVWIIPFTLYLWSDPRDPRCLSKRRSSYASVSGSNHDDVSKVSCSVIRARRAPLSVHLFKFGCSAILRGALYQFPHGLVHSLSLLVRSGVSRFIPFHSTGFMRSNNK